MTNRDMAHSFFYDPYGSKAPARSSVSYNNGAFYSYSTAICRIFTRDDGAKVAVFSENSFSVTTAKHRGHIIQACPFSRYFAFMDRRGDATEKELLNTNTRYLEQYAKSKLSQKANRETFAAAFHALENFLKLQEFKPLYKDIKKVLKKYQSIKDALKALNKKRIAAEKRKKELAERKRQATLRKFKKMSYIEKIKTAYTTESGLAWEIRSELRNALNPYRDQSFIWQDGDKIRTSQEITVDLKDAVILLKAWKAGKLKHGMTVDCYTVLNVSPDFIKVGCHKIPTENLTELCKELNV